MREETLSQNNNPFFQKGEEYPVGINTLGYIVIPSRYSDDLHLLGPFVLPSSTLPVLTFIGLSTSLGISKTQTDQRALPAFIPSDKYLQSLEVKNILFKPGNVILLYNISCLLHLRD